MAINYAVEIEALKRAIAMGARTVKYTDKEVEYRSLDEMKETLRFLENQAAPVTAGQPRVGFATFNRGG